MSFKCIRQHAMLSLFLAIAHSSEVADHHFNIEYEKRIAGHFVKSLIISFDYVNVNWMTYPLIKFWRLLKNLNTVPIEENNVDEATGCALSFITCTRHIGISIWVWYQWYKIIMFIQNLWLLAPLIFFDLSKCIFKAVQRYISDTHRFF
jgi:hypothetical protein